MENLKDLANNHKSLFWKQADRAARGLRPQASQAGALSRFETGGGHADHPWCEFVGLDRHAADCGPNT
jgi:hypothetical protein